MEKYVVRNIPRPDQQMIEAFSQLDVSTVYEAQGKIGLMNHEIKPIMDNVLICGPAVTVTCFAGDNLMIHAAIEVCQPGDILVITTIGQSTAGMIGELIVMALQKRGVKGVVIDAGIRDVSRIRELGFPIWTKAISSQGTTKTRGGWVNAPVICAGAAVNPGDLILADDDGVVVVRQDQLQQVLEASKQRMQREEQTKAKISNGELSVDFYSLREVLRQEKVVYYDHITDLKK
jgi:4-hydroxy-4-methyl-2-oxoglutarate aldolase